MGSERQKQISYINTYMWNLKKLVQMILFTKQKQRHRQRTKMWIPREEESGWDELGDWD